MSRTPTLAFWRGRLPHWEVVDGIYFITIRLHGCLPKSVLNELAAIASDASEKDWLVKSRRYFMKMEKWLHQHSDRDDLQNPMLAQLVANAFQYYAAQEIWKLHAYTIMPNHVHFFVTLKNKDLRTAVVDFKKYTAREGNRIARKKGLPFWQQEWFDHWARSPEEADSIIRYIHNNPVKAGYVKKWRDWPYSG